MKEISIKNDKTPIYNKRAIKIILILGIWRSIAGIVLSTIFVNEANYMVEPPI